MGDIRAHRMRWLAGYLYVGNGTLGVQDDIYFVPNTTSNTTVYVGALPFDGADAVFGASYVADVLKHYSKKIIRSGTLRIRPYGFGCSSTSGANIAVAPIRSDTIGYSTSTDAKTSGTAFSAVVGMKGAMQAPSWAGIEIPMTPFIASAAGTKEFLNFRDSATPTDLQGMAVPASWAVGGTNTSAGNRGNVVASVEGEWVCDLVDFVGGFTASVPGSRKPDRKGPAVPPGCPGDVKYAPDAPPVSKDTGGECSAGNEWELVEALDSVTGVLQPRYRNRLTGAIANSVTLPQPKLCRQ